MHSLLSCHEEAESLHNEGFRCQLILNAPPEESLDYLGTMVQDESHYSLFIEVSGEKRIETIVYGELAHVEHHPLEIELAGVARDGAQRGWRVKTVCLILIIEEGPFASLALG